MEFKHTPDMGEISGFGGGYEEACQQMLHNGVTWLQAHKDADIRVLEAEGIYGIVQEGTKQTEELSDAVMTGIKDATGAMYHAVMARLAYIHKNGWDKYCDEVRAYQRKDKEQGNG